MSQSNSRKNNARNSTKNKKPVKQQQTRSNRPVYTKMYNNYRKPYKYPGLGRRVGGTLGALGGTMFGAPGIGYDIGSAVGQGAHALVKTITGLGDYTVSENSLVYNRDAVPQFSTDNPRCTVVAHSEFIKDIRGSTTFSIDTFDINAGNAALFPWLSQIARNFEQVVWQGLVF